MEATRKRSIKSGTQYDRFFPPAEGGVYTVRKNATLDDTVAFIPKVVYNHINQTRAIAVLQKGGTLQDTCSNIWHFVYEHIQYRKDQNGYEQIRSPARTWRDRNRGVDCDCYSVFISSILLNLSIPHILRITKYRQDHYQHIYPVVPTATGEIIIDCVTDDFDYEVPYSEKKDFAMDLQFLNGFEGPLSCVEDTGPMAARFAGAGLGELGKFRFKNLLNVANKFNPATILLRNGLLASMKLNIGGVAEKLRWSYLTPAQAVAKGIDAQKFAKLVSVRKTLENIFYGAGGKLSNLKKAMLKGKGNKDRAVVAGLGELDFGDIDYMNGDTPLEQLLGPDIYYSENERTFQGLKGFGTFGEPATIASIAAASGVIVKLATALKKVGDLFGSKGRGSNTAVKKNADSPGTNNNANSSGQRRPNSSSSSSSGSTARPSSPAGVNKPSSPTRNAAIPKRRRNTSSRNEASPSDNTGASVNTGEGTSAASTDEDGVTTNTDNSSGSGLVITKGISPSPGSHVAATGNKNAAIQKGFWDKNKSWLKPVAIGAGGIAVLATCYHLLKPKPHPAGPPLSGPPKHTNNKNHPRKSKKHSTKKAVALL